MAINWGSIAGGAGGILGGLMGGSTPNYGSAEGSINQYTNEGVNKLNPYDEGGLAGMAGMEHFGDMFSNPEAFYQHFAANYQMSPGAQHQLHTGMNAVRAAMASRGLDGSGAEAKALTNYTQGVINQDMNSQYNNMMAAARMGMGAYGSLFGRGEGAAANEAGLYGNAGRDIAGMQQAQANADAAQKNANNSSILGGIGDLVGSFL